jgi:hypothetical protein
VSLLSGLPGTLRTELLDCYQEITRNYTEQRWEPAELNGGKLCEVVYSILEGVLTGTYPSKAYKPGNMLDSCRRLEGTPANANRPGDRSLRILIPRLLPFLYEIRNNRGVGHVGGDVDPNHEDAEAVLGMASWVLAELVRIFHGVSLSEAQAAVDALTQRRHRLVWAFEDFKRVLNPSMKKSDQALVLLYSETDWLSVPTLSNWVEYSSVSMFRTRVLHPLHESRMIEFQAASDRARISPLGIARVEAELIVA